MNPPPTVAPLSPASTDTEHLKLLSLFHYIVGGILGLISLFPVFHLIFGAFMLFAPHLMEKKEGEIWILQALGGFFMLFAGLLMAGGLSLAVASVMSGRYLSQFRNHTFSIVVAAILCAFMPFGTVLGVFTLIVLSRPSVKSLYR
jgi:hypothetical protein